MATIGVTLPSFIMMLTVMHFLKKFEESRIMNAVLDGIRPATVGLIASAVIFLAETTLFNGPLFSGALIASIKEYVNLLPCVIFIGTIILSAKFKIGPIKLTLLAGLVGALVIR